MASTGLISEAQKAFSVRSRQSKVRRIPAFLSATGAQSLLLVGITPSANKHENIVERGIAEAVPLVVASGLGVVTVEHWPRYVAADALALPFPEDSFDVVVSNAVIEHVGGEAEQRQFVAEHVRVAKDWIITTPNRYFPVESHTHVVCRHWSASWRARQRAFTRLLDRDEFEDLLPAGAHVRGSRLGPTFTAYSRPDQGMSGAQR